MPEKKSLIVSLHDAHPGSRAQIAEQIAFLAERGVTRSSILVVPEFHHQGSVTKDAAFCDDVSKWQVNGHEIVLHGYYHDRKGFAPDTLSNFYWTRLYTAGEAEFLDISPENARARLELGKTLFKSLGWHASGFVAPAWLMASGLPNLLAEMGFAYTTRVSDIVPLRSADGQEPVPPSRARARNLSYRCCPESALVIT